MCIWTLTGHCGAEQWKLYVRGACCDPRALLRSNTFSPSNRKWCRKYSVSPFLHALLLEPSWRKSTTTSICQRQSAQYEAILYTVVSSASSSGRGSSDCSSLTRRACLQLRNGTAATAGFEGSCCGGALVKRLRPARSSYRGSYVRRSWSSRGAVLPVWSGRLVGPV